MSMLESLRDYLVQCPKPLIGAKTIQLLIMREILDYTVLRTEETRELNGANTPLSESDRVTPRIILPVRKSFFSDSVPPEWRQPCLSTGA